MINSNFHSTINKSNSKIIWFSFLSGISLLLTGFIILVFIINSQKDIFPNKTTIEGIDVSLLSIKETQNKISSELGEQKDFLINIESEEIKYSTNSSSLNFKYLINESIDEAFTRTHENLTMKKPSQLIFSLFGDKSFDLNTDFDSSEVAHIVENFAEIVDKKGHQPLAILETTELASSLEIDPGKVGLEIDQTKLITEIESLLNNKTNYLDISLTPQPQTTYFELTKDEVIKAEERAKLFVGQTILLINNGYKEIKLKISDQDLVSLLSFPTGINDEEFGITLDLLNEQIKRDSRNAIFDYEEDEDGNFIVNEFIPHLDGLEINKVELENKITNIITSIDQTVINLEEIRPTYLDLPLKVVEPDITLDKTNELGIKELIGFGDSEYDHSIPNRIWNVSVATEKMNNILVAPGEEFRFNNTLGEVSRRTGYKSAYVISGGKTVLGDGGGVCQVSTTYFRAILNAGLEVTKRKAHSYRVSYYELNQKPGIDATVYSGDVDLRFLNDTGKHILIRSSADADELYMKVEIYGTSDGRTTEIVDHKTWGQRGAPASAYYPTTEIPAGTFKQIDWAVSGIKASFSNVIKDKDGELIREEEYYSNYVPWSAKYLQGI